MPFFPSPDSPSFFADGVQWWEAEMVRKPFMLDRARCVEECSNTHRQCPTTHAPIYLSRRAENGKPFPSLSLVAPRNAAAATPEKAEGHGTRLRRRKRGEDEDGEGQGPILKRSHSGEEGEEERAATVEFLVKGLPSELFTELLCGLRWRAGNSLLLPGGGKRKGKGEGGTPVKEKRNNTPTKEKKGAKKTAIATP